MNIHPFTHIFITMHAGTKIIHDSCSSAFEFKTI